MARARFGIRGVLSSMAGIPEHSRARQALVDAQVFERALEASHDGVVITDARREDNPAVYCNPAVERMTGYTRDEILGRNFRFLQGTDRDQPPLRVLRAALEAGEPCQVTLRNYAKDGRPFWNELSISPVRDNNGIVIYFIGIQKDVTDRVNAEQDLLRQRSDLEEANRTLKQHARHDALTGVYNRGYFYEVLDRQWRIASRRGEEVSILMIDIDHFKAYNDTLGHQAGDQCLKNIAQAIDARLQRAGDIFARYGGEEFVALLIGMGTQQALPVAEGLRRAIRALGIRHPHSPGPADVVTISIGVASGRPGPALNTERLIEEADRALYRAKAAGRDRVESTTPQQQP